MKHRCIRNNSSGVSLIYDAILFIVMVSLSGVILLPALTSNIATDVSLDIHREQVAEDTLHTYLVSRPNIFTYRFCGDILDDIAGRIGIDNSSEGLYRTLTSWVLAHEQQHKTYAALLAEDLGCQFQIPLSLLGIQRLNIVTGDYDRQLKNETTSFLSSILGEKYRFNLSAHWHPIKGISFGGKFTVGESPPSIDSYVARRLIIMPYAPVFTIDNQTIVFTKSWLQQHFFCNLSGFGHSTIPAITSIAQILENYTHHTPPYDVKENATKAIKENLSFLINGFLINGITNETNMTIFPGIIDIVLTSGFTLIKNIINECVNETFNQSFGEAVRIIDRCFSGLNQSQHNPLSTWLLESFNTTFQGLLNESYSSFTELFAACEIQIKETIASLLNTLLEASLDSFVDILFDVIDTVIDFSEYLINWLCNHISINSAEVTLCIWVVRE